MLKIYVPQCSPVEQRGDFLLWYSKKLDLTYEQYFGLIKIASLNDETNYAIYSEDDFVNCQNQEIDCEGYQRDNGYSLCALCNLGAQEDYLIRKSCEEIILSAAIQKIQFNKEPLLAQLIRTKYFIDGEAYEILGELYNQVNLTGEVQIESFPEKIRGNIKEIVDNLSNMKINSYTLSESYSYIMEQEMSLDKTNLPDQSNRAEEKKKKNDVNKQISFKEIIESSPNIDLSHDKAFLDQILMEVKPKVDLQKNNDVIKMEFKTDDSEDNKKEEVFLQTNLDDLFIDIETIDSIVEEADNSKEINLENKQSEELQESIMQESAAAEEESYKEECVLVQEFTDLTTTYIEYYLGIQRNPTYLQLLTGTSELVFYSIDNQKPIILDMADAGMMKTIGFELLHDDLITKVTFNSIELIYLLFKNGFQLNNFIDLQLAAVVSNYPGHRKDKIEISSLQMDIDLEQLTLREQVVKLISKFRHSYKGFKSHMKNENLLKLYNKELELRRLIGNSYEVYIGQKKFKTVLGEKGLNYDWRFRKEDISHLTLNDDEIIIHARFNNLTEYINSYTNEETKVTPAGYKAQVSKKFSLNELKEEISMEVVRYSIINIIEKKGFWDFSAKLLYYDSTDIFMIVSDEESYNAIYSALNQSMKMTVISMFDNYIPIISIKGYRKIS